MPLLLERRERTLVARVDVVPAIPLTEPFNLQLTKHFNTHTHTLLFHCGRERFMASFFLLRENPDSFS